MISNREKYGWGVTFAILVILSIPWFLWGHDGVVFGLPLWLWWHAGWMVVASITLWSFTKRAWGLGVHEVAD